MLDPIQNKSQDAEPKLPDQTLMNILANAFGSTQKHQQSGPALETKTCGSCGAARPSDTNLQFCDYCGHQFY